MNVLIKPKFILHLAAIITAMLLTFIPFSAKAGTIVDILFEHSPLFGETNLVPGDTVTRSVTVTSKAADNLIITTNAANVINTGGLGDRLNLTINKGAVNLYTGTMSAFFAAGVVDLGILTPGQTGIYEYTVSFDSASGNNFQDKTLSFDVSVSAQASAPARGSSPGLTGFTSGGTTNGGSGSIIANQEVPSEPTPTPRQEVLGEKITETAGGNNLAETGFSNTEFAYLILILFALLGFRALIKKST